MAKEQDLSSFAAFDLDDLLAEIESNKSKKEVTAYLDRAFLAKMINEYHYQAEINPPDFNKDNRIDLTEYNFTGADFRGINYLDFALCNFKNCDISAVKLDRQGVDFFREMMIDKSIIAQGLNLEGAYLGPVLTRRVEIGVECYIYLNLANLDLTGTNFKNCNIFGLILQNSNIAGCNFIGCEDMDFRQFAFSSGFESAIFSSNGDEDAEIKNKIKEYAQTLDPETYYEIYSSRKNNKIMAYLANLANFLDD